MRDIHRVLERWGGWAAGGGSGLDYSSVAAGFRGLIAGGGKRRLSCPDNDGMIIDCAMGCLKKQDAYLYTLLMWHYVFNTPVRVMGEKLGVSHTLVLKRLQGAEGFIDGCLCTTGAELEIDKFCERENSYPAMPKKVVEFHNAI